MLGAALDGDEEGDRLASLVGPGLGSTLCVGDRVIAAGDPDGVEDGSILRLGSRDGSVDGAVE